MIGRTRTIEGFDIQYRPDIDGLRAVAVVAVVTFHAFPQALPGGFVGVDIFFVISGYLISGIIFGRLQTASFSIAEFYQRRVRRIFPALTAVLLASLLFGWFALLFDEFARLGKHVAGGAAFMSNFVLLKESGYFDPIADTKPLLHLWSLAVEEQFYLLWPPLLILAQRRHWNVFWLTAIVAALSFGANLYLIGRNPNLAFYSPLSRFWELMLGGLLAHRALHAKQPVYLASLRATLGIAMLGVALACIGPSNPFPGLWALLPCGAAALILSAGPDAWVNRSLLACRPAVLVGLVSYPLYLWHWPLLSFARIIASGQPSIVWRLSLVVLAALLATITYRCIELPLRTGSHGTRKALRLFVAMMMICFVGLTVYARWLPARNAYPQWEAAARGGDFEFLTDRAPPGEARSGIYTWAGDGASRVVFAGDSHVAQYAPRIAALREQSKSPDRTTFVVGGGCVPIPGVYEDLPVHQRCRKLLADADEALGQSNTTVVIGAAWNTYFVDGIGHARRAASEPDYYFLEAERKTSFLTGNGAALALAALERWLTTLSHTHTVYLLLDNPSGTSFDPHAFLDRHLPFVAPPPTSAVPLEDAQMRLREQLIALAQRAGARVIDPVDALCQSGRCPRITPAGEPLYKDATHLAAPWITAHAGYIDAPLLTPR